MHHIDATIQEKLNGFHLNVISVSRYKNKNIRLKFYVVAKYYFGKM